MMVAGNNGPSKKPVVLLCCDWYAPGYKAGGPVQSVIHLSEAIAGATEVYVLTSDRDLNEREAYEGINTDTWLTGDAGVHVMYVSPQKQHLSWYKKVMDAIKPDVLHLNSMWSVKFAILPLLAFSDRKNKRIILSPRGMLNEGSFRFKRLKKISGLLLFRLFGLLKGVNFHATDEVEKLEIKQKLPGAEVVVIPNIAGDIKNEVTPAKKHEGLLKLVYIGRIAPQKNVHFILEVLKEVRDTCSISFSLIGLEDDEDYSRKCRKIADKLPSNITVSFLGALPHAYIHEKLLENHFLIQTSFSENFGHSVFESLASGRPVIISDGMPWKHLAASRAGYVIPLSNKFAFVQALEEAADMNQSTYDHYCLGALDYAVSRVNYKELQKQYVHLYIS